MTIIPNRQWALIAGPLLAIAVAAGMNQSGWEDQACWTGAVAILCVVWWIFEPVSYTHLRAHETVLDLVCRLLLEKKNINNQNQRYKTLNI